MSLQAARFSVSLERSGAGEAVCLVTAHTEFTQQVQSALKFSITSRAADGCKAKVPLRQDLCRLSGDLAQFRFGFAAAEVGTYKVIVKFGDAHISSSPLHFHVPDQTGPNLQPGREDVGIAQNVETWIETGHGDERSDAKVSQSREGPAGQATDVALIDINSNRRREDSGNSAFVTPEQSVEAPGVGEALEAPGGREVLLQELEAVRAVGLPLAARLLERELELAGAGPERLVGEARSLLERVMKRLEAGGGEDLGLLEKMVEEVGQLEETVKEWQPEVEEEEVLLKEEEVLLKEDEVLPKEEVAKDEVLSPPLPRPLPRPQQLLVPLASPSSLPRPDPAAESPISLPPKGRTSAAPTFGSSLPRLATAGALNLARSPATLGATRMFTIPMSARDQPKNPNRSLANPIGMCLLHGGNIVVASSFDDKVKMFDPAGTYLGPVLSGTSGKFSRPADMVCLGSGEFVVKDDTKLRLFSSEGTFRSVICEHRAATKCFGLAEDDEGRLVCIRRAGRETDLVFWDVESKQIVKRMTLEDIIADKANSKCRFLTFQGGKLYITDLGLNKVYVIDAKTYTVMKAFGAAGSGPGCFDDPAGLGVDAAGNMVVADSKNHRLGVFSAQGVFLGQPRLPEVRRPSGLLLDSSNKHLFVLNLAGQIALVKYKLNC